MSQQFTQDAIKTRYIQEFMVAAEAGNVDRVKDILKLARLDSEDLDECHKAFMKFASEVQDADTARRYLEISRALNTLYSEKAVQQARIGLVRWEQNLRRECGLN